MFFHARSSLLEQYQELHIKKSGLGVSLAGFDPRGSSPKALYVVRRRQILGWRTSRKSRSIALCKTVLIPQSKLIPSGVAVGIVAFFPATHWGETNSAFHTLFAVSGRPRFVAK